MRHELEKIKEFIHKLNVILSKQQKVYGWLVLMATIIGALLETIGVSAILPVVQGLMDTEGLRTKWYLEPFIKIWNIQDTKMLIYLVCGEVIAIYITKNLYFIFYTWISKKYSYKIRRELGIRVMNAYMEQGYIFFVNNNTSRLIQGTTGDVGAVTTILNALFTMATKLLSVFAIGGYIIMQSPNIAITLLMLAILSMFLIHVIFNNTIKKYGVMLRTAEREVSRTSLEAIQGSKEILVSKRQKYFVDRYVKSTNEHIKACVMLDMAGQTPSYIIEMICVVGLLIVIAIEMGKGNTSVQMVETLSIIAVAAFRIFPGIATISSSLNTVRSRMPSFNAAYETVERVNQLEEEKKNERPNTEWNDIEKDHKLDAKSIELEHVFYKYPNTEKYILEDVNLAIRPNTSIGIIGFSGAGKSTLVDVILGLLEPEKGRIFMNGYDIKQLGEQWNQSIGYVPQSVYLIDGTIRDNIAFGIERKYIDDKMVWNALRMAQMEKFVKELPKGLDTQVGERGVKFSGGQRQRVAIARALYLNPEILILDEATASLDNETERALMDGIEALLGKKTLIIVAHRLTTIGKCELIYEVKDGKIEERDKNIVLGAKE